MSGLALYNEIDPHAAATLRELINRGQIAPGVVDTRSIEDLTPAYVQQFTQVHLFAGIGIWSLALRNAGWPDSRPVWTGSCPCQPFSAAGKGLGVSDERHLWPAMWWLVSQCRPDVVFGEQVAKKDGLAWLDIVASDLEAGQYALGAVCAPAAGFGAPHLRERLYWVADTDNARPQGGLRGRPDTQRQNLDGHPGRRGATGDMADAPAHGRHQGVQPLPGGLPERSGGNSVTHGLADTVRHGAEHGPLEGVGAETTADRRNGGLSRERLRVGEQGALGGMADTHDGDADRAGPTNGFWRNADWIGCRDAKWRPVEPGTFPLVNGAPARVGRLRAYGNAIVEPQARAFIEAYLGQ